MNIVLINDPKFKDYSEVIKLHNEVFSKLPGYEEYSAKIAHQLMSEAKDPKVVKTFNDERCLIAYAICYERYKDYYHIWQIGVDEKHRNKGIGTKMYEVIENYAKSKKYEGVTINSFKDYIINIHLIEKRGYQLYKKDKRGEYSKNPKLMFKKVFK